MPRTDDLRALLARVEEAEGGNATLSTEVEALALRRRMSGHRVRDENGRWYRAPPNTISVDAALLLIRQALPDAYLDMDGTLGKPNWCVTIRIGDHDAGETWTRPSPALALIAALLTALIARETSDAG